MCKKHFAEVAVNSLFSVLINYSERNIFEGKSLHILALFITGRKRHELRFERND